jgi:ABC-2 type transport system permease protein
MDFRKFAQIVKKDVLLLIKDRATLMIIIITPLVLTFVIGAAFSGIGGERSAIKNIPVVVVNQDKGAAIGPQTVNFGQNLTDALRSVGELLKVDVLTDENRAREQVRQGKAAAAVLIPPNFSESLNPMNPAFGDNKITLTVFRDAGSPLNAEIAASVVRQITNGLTNVNVALYAAGKTSPNPLFLVTQANVITNDLIAQSASGDAPISTAIAGDSSATKQPTFDLLQYFAPSMAIFFLNFAMAFGVLSIIEERDNGTLQRLLVSPTNRMTILAGKLGGTYVNGILQLTVLIVATTVIAPLLGSQRPVWGTNVLALAVLTLIVVAGSIGFGTLIAAVARTRQQANVYVSAVMTLMGLAGGAFFAVNGDPGLIAKLTVNFWATSAYQTLARTNDLMDVLPNIAVLLTIFVVCFAVGMFLFNRRLDV